MISRTWRIATLSAGIIAPLECQRRDPKQASGGARRHSRPRAALFRSGGRHHLVMVGGIIPLRRATSSRYDGRLGQESARINCVANIKWLNLVFRPSGFAPPSDVNMQMTTGVQ